MFYWVYSPRMEMQFKGHHHTRNHNRFTHNNNHGGDHQNRSHHTYTDHLYPGEQFLPMGGEIPLVRSQSYGHHSRGNRGGGRAWRDRNYVQAAGRPATMPPQSQLITSCYSQVPNLTSKKNVWNKSNKANSTRSDNGNRGVLTLGPMNPSGDSNCSLDVGKNGSTFLLGFPVVMCGTNTFKCNTNGFKCIEDARPLPHANQPIIQDQSQNTPLAICNTPQHQNSGQDSQHNTVFNQTVTIIQSNTSIVTLETSHPTTNHTAKRRLSHRTSSMPPLGVHRAIRGRFQGNLERNIVDSRCLEYLDLPDRYLARNSLGEVFYPPNRLFTGGSWDKLSEGMWNMYVTNQQTNNTFKGKLHLWKYLWTMVKESFPHYSLYLVGSTMSGLGCDDSDVDLCLLVRQSHMDQRSEAVVHLEQMLELLRSCDFVLEPIMIQAKVPILKFRDNREGYDVDLNCNNAVGIRNTHLLYCYSRLDWRVRPMVLIVKMWAHKHNINEAKNMTISSYSLVLMVIHFMQCGVNPPLLPCLHSLYPEKFGPYSDVEMIDMHEQLPPYASPNEQTIGELLHNFLAYYATFDYSQFAISVRLAATIPIEECRRVRSYKNDPHQWKHLCIEEPFDLTNTARSVYDPEVFEKVKAVFSTSLSNLKKSYCLESIFQDAENG